MNERLLESKWKTEWKPLRLSDEELEWLRQHLVWFKGATAGPWGEYNICTNEDDPHVNEILEEIALSTKGRENDG